MIVLIILGGLAANHVDGPAFAAPPASAAPPATAAPPASAAPIASAAPATQSADPTMDWLLAQSTTAPAAAIPATAPSTQASVFVKPDDGSRIGTIILSDGRKLTGPLSTTPDQPIRIYDNDKKVYRDVPFKLIKSLKASVDWERDEAEWKFKESGSDIKEYTGKTYPARETAYTMTLENDQTITGAVDVPIYLQTDAGSKLFVIHKRDKGDVGQKLADLVYIQEIDFAD